MPKGKYYDDVVIGQQFVTARRTITAAEVVLFAGLSANYDPLFTDHEYALSRGLPGIAAHELLITAIATGLRNQMGLFEGTTLALLGIKVSVHCHVFPGNTIWVESIVMDKKETSKPDRGIIKFQNNVVNQARTVVQVIESTVMVAKR